MTKFYYQRNSFNLLLITIALVVGLNSASFALNQLLCFIPKTKDFISTKQTQSIDLYEDTTIAKFDKFDNLKSIKSPDCNKFESTSVWSNKLIITCKSNAGERITIEINKKNMTIFKTKDSHLNKQVSLNGFCKRIK
jgi:hypothetical protein